MFWHFFWFFVWWDNCYTSTFISFQPVIGWKLSLNVFPSHFLPVVVSHPQLFDPSRLFGAPVPDTGIFSHSPCCADFSAVFIYLYLCLFNTQTPRCKKSHVLVLVFSVLIRMMVFPSGKRSSSASLSWELPQQSFLKCFSFTVQPRHLQFKQEPPWVHCLWRPLPIRAWSAILLFFICPAFLPV